MSEIRVRENESLESALKRFKRSCAKSGVLAEVRKREHYESPSVKRRKKSAVPSVPRYPPHHRNGPLGTAAPTAGVQVSRR